MNINTDEIKKENTKKDLSRQPTYTDETSPLSVSIWDKIRASKSKHLSKAEKKSLSETEAEKMEKDKLVKAEAICNEDVNKPPVLETIAKCDINQTNFLKAGIHSRLSLRYTDTINGKKVRKIITIGYGYNTNDKIMPNLINETKKTSDFEMVGMQIELSEETLESILNYIFLYFDKYSNKYNLITRNCNDFVKNVLRQARKGRKKNRDSDLDNTTDWDALEEAYKNHNCISPATVLNRSLKNIKKNSKNMKKYFFDFGYVGFIGVLYDRVQLPTDTVKFRVGALQASQRDLSKKFYGTDIFLRKDEEPIAQEIENVARAIGTAQSSANKIIDKSNINNVNKVNKYGYNKEALKNTSEACRTVADKSRKIIQVSGRRHKHLDIFALSNSTLFDSVATQMSDLNSDISFISKYDVEKYDYDKLEAVNPKSRKNGDYKKGAFLLDNRIPTGIFFNTKEYMVGRGKIEKRRITSIIDKINITNLLKAKKLYANLSNKAIAEMMTEDIESYIFSLGSVLKSNGPDVDGLSVYHFGEGVWRTFLAEKFGEEEKKAIRNFIELILANHKEKLSMKNKQKFNKIKNVGEKNENIN